MANSLESLRRERQRKLQVRESFSRGLERFRRDPAANLLYGAGIHVCPGAPLARLELRLIVETLLARTTAIEPVPDQPPTKAGYPVSGFSALPLRIR